MAFRRGRNVNNVWFSLPEELFQVAKILFDREPLV